MHQPTHTLSPQKPLSCLFAGTHSSMAPITLLVHMCTGGPHLSSPIGSCVCVHVHTHCATADGISTPCSLLHHTNTAGANMHMGTSGSTPLPCTTIVAGANACTKAIAARANPCTEAVSPTLTSALPPHQDCCQCKCADRY